MTTTPTSTCNKKTKVKRPREGWFCVIVFEFFVVGLFFSLGLCQAQNNFENVNT